MEVTEDSPKAHGRAPVHVLRVTRNQVLHFTLLSPCRSTAWHTMQLLRPSLDSTHCLSFTPSHQHRGASRQSIPPRAVTKDCPVTMEPASAARLGRGTLLSVTIPSFCELNPGDPQHWHELPGTHSLAWCNTAMRPWLSLTKKMVVEV